MAAHGGNVAQAAGNAAVAYHNGRVPGAAKMHVFDTEIGGNQQFRAGEKAQNGAIVAYAANQRANLGGASKTPNCFDQISFLNHKSGYNYIKSMYLFLVRPPSREQESIRPLGQALKERKANAPSWLGCSAGQPTFVTLHYPSGVDSMKAPC
jgi:hypothetical protein